MATSPTGGGTLVDRLYREFRRVRVWELDDFFATHGHLWLDDAAEGRPYEETTHLPEHYEAFTQYKQIVSNTLDEFATSPRTALGDRPAGLGFRSLAEALEAVRAEAERSGGSAEAALQQERLEDLLRDAESFEAFVAMMRSKARSQRHALLLLADRRHASSGGPESCSDRSRDSTRRSPIPMIDDSSERERSSGATSPLRHERRDQYPSSMNSSTTESLRRRRDRERRSPLARDRSPSGRRGFAELRSTKRESRDEEDYADGDEREERSRRRGGRPGGWRSRDSSKDSDSRSEDSGDRSYRCSPDGGILSVDTAPRRRRGGPRFFVGADEAHSDDGWPSAEPRRRQTP